MLGVSKHNLLTKKISGDKEGTEISLKKEKGTE